MFTEHVQGEMSLFWGSHAIKNVPFEGLEWDILFPKTYMVSGSQMSLLFQSRFGSLSRSPLLGSRFVSPGLAMLQ